MNDLINLETIVDEVTIDEKQLSDLYEMYGCRALRILERQILDKGFVLERHDSDMTIKICRNNRTL